MSSGNGGRGWHWVLQGDMAMIDTAHDHSD